MMGSEETTETKVDVDAAVDAAPTPEGAPEEPTTGEPNTVDAQAGNLDPEESDDAAAVQANAEGVDAEPVNPNPHSIAGVDGGELRIIAGGETTTVEIIDAGDSIEVDTLAFRGAASADAPANAGESLATTASNPNLPPDSPGIEPGQGVDDEEGASGTVNDTTLPDAGPQNAPPSTDPGGDTSKENAPDVTAPEPNGPNVTTNPGTDSASESQVEAPESPEGAQPVDGESPIGGAVGATVNPDAGTETTSAASELPLYLEGGDGYSAAGLETPDGQTLYHFAEDCPGESHNGDAPLYADADDGEQPIVVSE